MVEVAVSNCSNQSFDSYKVNTFNEKKKEKNSASFLFKLTAILIQQSAGAYYSKSSIVPVR